MTHFCQLLSNPTWGKASWSLHSLIVVLNEEWTFLVGATGMAEEELGKTLESQICQWYLEKFVNREKTT